jgi:nicotinamide riboside kinase
MNLRVYFVGAASTGKTTLARWVSRRFGLPMLGEVAREVLAEMETTLAAVHADVELADRFQSEVFRRQLDKEAARPSFVSDRAFDNLVYAAQHSRVAEKLWQSEECGEYLERLKDDGVLVFFVRPHRELLKDDGVRVTDWEDVCRTDGGVQVILETQGIPYTPIAMISLRDRLRLVEAVIRDRLPSRNMVRM